MTKIMLVEDDKSLREIYGVRLLAEGYDIVSAGDGEEALAMAIKERPQLIVSDVMMPKVSGYDMLDILRSTTETKNIRVIMMTALSSEEQRLRAESLGADRYLVKSQVGIEDVVRVVHEVLEDLPGATAPQQPAAASPVAEAALVTPQPVRPVTPVSSSPAPQVATPVLTTPDVPTAPTAPVAPAAPVPAQASIAVKSPSSTPKPASLKDRVIQPLHDPTIAPVNINDLLDKELAKEAGLTDTERPQVESLSQEKAAINEQLKSFIPPEPTPVEAPASMQPSVPVPSTPSLLPTPGVGATPAPVTPVVAVTVPPAVAPPVQAIPVPPTPPVPPAPSVPGVMPSQQNPTVPQAPTVQQLPEVPTVS